MAFSRESNQRPIGRAFLDQLRLRHHFVKNMCILSINRGCKKVNIAVWARKRTSFGDTTDSMTERTLKLHGHASMRHTLRSLPVTATTRQAIAIELRLAIRTVDIARPRYGSKSKTGTTECLVEISVHRFHTDSHRETLVAGLLRFRTQRPAEVDGGSFRSEGIGKRLRQGLRLLWMAPRRQMYHSNR